MNIAYQSSNEFSVHTGISLFSLLYNNKDISNLNIYLLSNGISNDELDKIKNLVKSFDRKLYIIDLMERFNIVKKKYNLMDFNNINACAEMLPADIFSQEVDEILLIDSDTIVDGSIKNIRPISFDQYVISAVPNYQFNYSYENLDSDSKKVIDKNGLYFNSGVVLYNLKKWRELNCDSLIINAIKETEDRSYFASQTILNLAIPKKYVHLMSYKYNYFGFQYNKYIGQKIHQMYNENIKEIEEHPIILHYKGFFNRPWFKELNSKEIKKYRYYKKQTEWANYPLESIYNSLNFKNANLLTKFKLYLIIKFQKNNFLNFILYLKSKKK